MELGKDILMIAVIKKLSSLMNKQQKIRIGLIFLITVFGAFLEVIGVSLMLPLVSAMMDPDIIQSNEAVRKICEVFSIESHKNFVLLCILGLVFIFIFKNVYLVFQYYLQARFVFNNQFAMQQRLLNAYLSKPYEFFLNADSGELIRGIQNDVSATYSLLTILISLFSESIVSIALAITIFLIDPVMMTFVAVILSLVILVLAKLIKPILRKKGLERLEHGGLTYKWLIQAIQGIKEIKVTKKENFFLSNYGMSGKAYINAEKWNTVFSHIPRLMIEMTVMCAMFLFLAIIIMSGRDIHTLIPVLAAFAMAALKLMPSANRIIGAVNTIAFGEPALDKLLQNIHYASNWEATGGSENKEKKKNLEISGEISFKNLSYRYPESETYILNNVSMDIPIGASVGIVGKSGSGKTTVVDLMLGLLKAEKGKIEVGGRDIFHFYEDWLKHIGYISQHIFLLDESIRKNIAFGLSEKDIDENRVLECLRKAELLQFVETLPEGMNTKIGERGVRLSGGQRQRIGIARALYMDPQILVFDEATAALDNETEAAIMKSVYGLHGEKTMIIIAHRLQTIEHCDLVYRVQDGKIVRER